MESNSRLLEWLAGLGVSPDYRALGAMMVLYLLGILAVLLVIVVLLRRRRRAELPPHAPPVREEGPAAPSAEVGVQEAAAEEVAAPVAPPAPPAPAPLPPTPAEPVEPAL